MSVQKKRPVKWYYQEMGQTVGPISPSTLLDLSRSGKITPFDKVRKGLEGNWIDAGRVKGLFDEKPRDPPKVAVVDSQLSPPLQTSNSEPIKGTPRSRFSKKSLAWGITASISGGTIIVGALLYALAINSAATVDFELFEGVNRAAKTLSSASLMGTNFSRFHELVEILDTEIELIRDRDLTAAEQQCLQRYQDAHSIYLDCFLVWEAEVSNEGLLGGEHIRFDASGHMVEDSWRDNSAPTLILVDNNLREITEEHGIPLIPTEAHSEFARLKLEVQHRLQELKKEKELRELGFGLGLRDTPSSAGGIPPEELSLIVAKEKYITSDAISYLMSKGKASAESASDMLY